MAAEIDLRDQISRQSDGSPLAFAGSLPIFLRNVRNTQKNRSSVQIAGSNVFLTSYAMSALERSQSAETSQKIEYTVKQTAKVHREKLEDPRPSIWLSVVKWLVGIFLFVSVLTCLVASKISLLSIAYYYDQTEKDDKDCNSNRETIFIMIVLALMIPEAVSFLKACWSSLLLKNHKWPRGKAVLVVSYR